MKEIQVNGPYFSNYSLAQVNRELALALSKVDPSNFTASLYCDPERIDYNPSPEELAASPELKKLVEAKGDNPHVVIYNNFPKNFGSLHGFEEMPGEIKLMYIAWEESVYPEAWVEEINKNLHGVMAATSFVREILRNSGVKVPITVVWNALSDRMKSLANSNLSTGSNSESQKSTQSHTIHHEVFPLVTHKKFKFLHISTAKMRKGVDVLLKAYFSAFSKNDDVVLIIKSFPGPDNMVENLLNELRTPDSPEVLHINNPNLTKAELVSLIKQSDCSVYPSRAEGFGLPILESMYLEVPVIATNYSGYLDFFDDSVGWPIDYKLEYANDSEFANIGAKWAEPDQDHLERLMREQFESMNDEVGNMKDETRSKNYELRMEKITKAKEKAETISWENSAEKTIEFIKQVEEFSHLKSLNAGVISFINDETGIADYTEDLYSKIECSFQNFYYFGNLDIAEQTQRDKANVIRNWNIGEQGFDNLKNWLSENHLDIMHIQYHSGAMFSAESLDTLIKMLKDLGIKTFLTLHAVRGSSFDFVTECRNLGMVDKIFIHNKSDLEYARRTLKNTELFIHPILSAHQFKKERVRKQLGILEKSPILVTHGLMNKNKGIENIVKAVEILKRKHPQILFISLSAVSSNNIFAQGILDELKLLIKERNLEENVTIVIDFLDDDVIGLILQASDVNIFAYADAGESASGAVRKGINSLNPTIVTDIIQFSEFEDEVLKIPNNDPQFIANAVDNLLQDEETAEKMVNSARDFVQKNNFETKSRDLLTYY